MNFFHNVTLADFSTMRLGGPAAHMAEIHSHQELTEALAWAANQQLPVIMIGSGSNIVWNDSGYPGLVLVDKIKRYEVFEEDETNVYVTIGSGELWDSVVERTVQAGLTGIEALSLIPGTAGATPVQNVGAYGQEISQTLVTVEAYDTQTGQFLNIPAMDCAFAYRTSRFKTTDHGRFFITGVTLHLTKGNPQPPYYPSVQTYFEEHGISQPTPHDMRSSVIAIRSAKLPDPAVVANNGSFFANPIVDEDVLVQLQADYPDIPHWPTSDSRVKLSAAWLIEQAGFKDFHDPETGMATWPKQPLVFVNEHAKSTADLLKFRQKILDAVQAKFQIGLVQEPELLP
ncbi:MAG TPA: UDP-N-acetylmuramate dehydrogenase [Candidatus Saccharimonadales bacterium]|nr:UDP-N-acetylmuramate dehydrogenase [Candidatus Saccharimonadales bacterium]